MILASEDTRTATPDGVPVIFEAIVKQQAVAATYNRCEIILAPHVIYTRHGELYVDGITLERDGKPPREEKLGAFKLSGLAPLRLTPRRFSRHALFQPDEPRYVGETLMAVEG